MEKREKILLIDDEKEVVNALKRALENKGYELFVTTMPQEAIFWIEQELIDLIICDQQLPGMSGVDILAHSKKFLPEAIRILITGYADLSVAVAAINEGSIYHYISKPWDNDELNRIVREGLDKKHKPEQDGVRDQLIDHDNSFEAICKKIDQLQAVLLPENKKRPIRKQSAPIDRRAPMVRNKSPENLQKVDKERCSRKISVWDKDDILIMKTSEVTFISAVNGEVIIHTVNGDFKSSETLSCWEEKLKGQHFLRCHRSYIVNVEKIEKISPWFHGAFNLKLKDVKESVPVSRNSVKSLKEYIDL